MNRYILTEEDGIRVLPPRGGEGAMIEVLCGRTMIFFELERLESAGPVQGTPWRHGTCGALRFLAPDALLGARHKVYVPFAHADCAAFAEELKKYAPEGIFAAEAEQFVPETCDHNGTRRSDG